MWSAVASAVRTAHRQARPWRQLGMFKPFATLHAWGSMQHAHSAATLTPWPFFLLSSGPIPPYPHHGLEWAMGLCQGLLVWGGYLGTHRAIILVIIMRMTCLVFCDHGPARGPGCSSHSWDGFLSPPTCSAIHPRSPGDGAHMHTILVCCCFHARMHTHTAPADTHTHTLSCSSCSCYTPCNAAVCLSQRIL